MLKRRVSLRVNFYTRRATRAWFLREAEALGQLDHPAIRHVYDVGVVGDVAYRVGNWIDGEGLQRRGARGAPADPHGARARARPAGRAGARPPAGHHRAPDRRPPRCIVSAGGRGTVTDLRFCSYTPPGHPAGHAAHRARLHGAGGARRAPGRSGERRLHRRGAALLRGHRPGAGARPRAQIRRPTELRPTCPARDRADRPARAASPSPDDRYLTAAEMLEDFASEAGTVRDRVGRASARPRLDTGRGPGALGEAAAPRPGRRLRAARRCWAPAGSAGSTGCATCTSSARSRSRCCTRR